MALLLLLTASAGVHFYSHGSASGSQTSTVSGPNKETASTTAPDEPASSASTASNSSTSTSGKVIWEDRIDETGTLDNVKLEQCASDRTQVVPDPTGIDRRVARMTVFDSDVAPCTPTENPRAQMLSPRVMEIGKEYYVGFSFFMPADFPDMKNVSSDWVAINSVYGPPYAGSSSNGYTIEQDTAGGPWFITMQLNEDYGWERVWRQQLVKGKWLDIVAHYKVDTEANGGFREQWVNEGSGWKQTTFKNGTTRQNYSVISDANNSGPNESKLILYHNRGGLPTATTYFADHKIGTSFEAVAPKSYDVDSPVAQNPLRISCERKLLSTDPVNGIRIICSTVRN